MNVWHGYNSDEDRRHNQRAFEAWMAARNQQAQRESETIRPGSTPVRGFDTAAEADAFHAEIERWLKGESA